jgi:hypothetical protein
MTTKTQNKIGEFVGILGGLFVGTGCTGQALLARNGEGFEIFLGPLALLLFFATSASAIRAERRFRLWSVITVASILIPFLAGGISLYCFQIYLACAATTALGIVLGFRLTQITG